MKKICKNCSRFEQEHYFEGEPAEHYGQCPRKPGKALKENETCWRWKAKSKKNELI
jgi:hypothetical protein